jgi:chaperonin cofactor prefoldin
MSEFDDQLDALEERVELVEITLDVLRERIESLSIRLNNFSFELEQDENY